MGKTVKYISDLRFGDWRIVGEWQLSEFGFIDERVEPIPVIAPNHE
jgi:hypothetical protein